MSRARRGLAIVLLALGAVPAPASPVGSCAAAEAAGASRAGLVIEFPDGSARRFCVSFREASITGLDLLRRSGVDLDVQDYGGDRVTVCAIEGRGCRHPGGPCFCRCADTSDCAFWGYYVIDDRGEWRFSDLGAGEVTVRDGHLNGWRWGSHAGGRGVPPAAATPSSVCRDGIQIGAAGRARPASRSGTAAWGGAGLAVLALWALLSRRRTTPQEPEEPAPQ